MKKMTLRPGVLVVAAIVAVGLALPAVVNALLPVVNGTFHACKSDSNGAMRATSDAVSCESGESAMQWDRGIIGFAYAPQPVDVDSVAFTEGDVAINITRVFQNGNMNSCVDMPGDIANKARFVTVNGGANDLVLRDAGISSNDLDTECGTGYEGIYRSQSTNDQTTILIY